VEHGFITSKTGFMADLAIIGSIVSITAAKSFLIKNFVVK
jgi:hypothetical protein